MTKRMAQRHELMDLPTYAQRRDGLRADILTQKAKRRIHLGKYLTFLFENHATVLYQVQEMLRVEGTTSEAAIQHELDTYNELLGAPGDLGCTLLVEIDDVLQRDIVLRKWLSLPQHLYVRVGDEKVRALWDERQVGDDRLSAVQYLRFPVEGRTPDAVGVDAEDLSLEVALTPEQREALGDDLRDG